MNALTALQFVHYRHLLVQYDTKACNILYFLYLWGQQTLTNLTLWQCRHGTNVANRSIYYRSMNFTSPCDNSKSVLRKTTICLKLHLLQWRERWNLKIMTKLTPKNDQKMTIFWPKNDHFSKVNVKIMTKNDHF